jgi:hypothetical protein
MMFAKRVQYSNDCSRQKMLDSPGPWTDLGGSYHVDVSMGILPEWMVYVMENPNLKWMIQRGTTISGNPHVKT